MLVVFIEKTRGSIYQRRLGLQQGFRHLNNPQPYFPVGYLIVEQASKRRSNCNVVRPRVKQKQRCPIF